MDKKTILPRSQKPMTIQLIIVGIVGLIIFIFTTQLFRWLDNLLPLDTSGLTSIARWLMLFALIVALLIVWYNAKKASYYVTNDSIVVSKGALGSKNKRVYGLDHVTSLSLSQSFFGSRLGYGHVLVDLSMLSNIETIRLTNLENPEEALRKIQKLVSAAK